MAQNSYFVYNIQFKVIILLWNIPNSIYKYALTTIALPFKSLLQLAEVRIEFGM